MCNCEEHKVEIDRVGSVNSFTAIREQIVKYRCSECGREWTVTVILGEAETNG